eukprot:TRINITY_DN2424_c0_g1_i15.p2 TRINITY_DN2424_c0_g1~~TRINITY_DN2424_c0_g1_i15.p2  ORF type:complete len:200 (-),score=32.61 TRINITY_DN2424_c0_g1_i15:962-1561(-)
MMNESHLAELIAQMRSEKNSDDNFEMVIREIHHPERRFYWTFILKHIILFDCLVEEQMNLTKICSLSPKPIILYNPPDEYLKTLMIDQLIRQYFSWTQKKAELFVSYSQFFQRGTKVSLRTFLGMEFVQLLDLMACRERIYHHFSQILLTCECGHTKYQLSEYAVERVMISFNILHERFQYISAAISRRPCSISPNQIE